MIWAILIGLFAILGLYIMYPFLRTQAAVPAQALEEAKAQRATVDADEAAGRLSPQAAGEARDALDRRILALLDERQTETDGERIKSLALFIVPATLLLGGVGIYTQVGCPSYEPITFAEYQAEQVAQLPDTLEGLVVELSARLEADPNPPAEGYVLLARSYGRLQQADNAMAAYAKAIELSDGAPAIVEERDRMIQLFRDRSTAPAIDPETRDRIAAMSPEEQAAMIENMVEGLAVRLEQDPNDIQGWLRLIRARAVMGDLPQAQRDFETASALFAAETPEGQALAALAANLFPPVAEAPQ